MQEVLQERVAKLFNLKLDPIRLERVKITVDELEADCDVVRK